MYLTSNRNDRMGKVDNGAIRNVGATTGAKISSCFLNVLLFVLAMATVYGVIVYILPHFIK